MRSDLWGVHDMQGKFGKWFVCMGLILALGLAELPALAQAAQYKLTRDCKVYQAANKSSKALKTLDKGDKVTVTAISGKWAKVKSGTQAGYMPKSALEKVTASTSANKTTLRQIQTRLVDKGYLASGSATGKRNGATTKAIRIFQMMNGLKVTGKANDATVKKLMSSSAKKRRSVNSANWAKSGINTRFRDGGVATIIDLASGARLQIRRVGGTNHLDVEPKTASDTATLKKVYGGAWSWDSRAILLIAGGRYYAAAMNGMPHGAQISHTNNFDGQFCIHLKNSLTHGTKRLNSAHQANIKKVIAYFS